MKISDAQWNHYFPDHPKPPELSYKTFCALREALWAEEDREDDIQSLGDIQQIQRKSKQPEFYAPLIRKLTLRVQDGKF